MKCVCRANKGNCKRQLRFKTSTKFPNDIIVEVKGFFGFWRWIRVSKEEFVNTINEMEKKDAFLGADE